MCISVLMCLDAFNCLSRWVGVCVCVWAWEQTNCPKNIIIINRSRGRPLGVASQSNKNIYVIHFQSRAHLFRFHYDLPFGLTIFYRTSLKPFQIFDFLSHYSHSKPNNTNEL